MSEPKLEIEPPQAIQAENVNQSLNEGPTNFSGPRRGRGGSRFNNGPGPMHRGGFRVSNCLLFNYYRIMYQLAIKKRALKLLPK